MIRWTRDLTRLLPPTACAMRIEKITDVPTTC
jgi:hypothetical protein